MWRVEKLWKFQKCNETYWTSPSVVEGEERGSPLLERKKTNPELHPKTWEFIYRKSDNWGTCSRHLDVFCPHFVNQNLCKVLAEEGEWEAPWFSCTMEELKILLRRNILFCPDRMRSWPVLNLLLYFWINILLDIKEKILFSLKELNNISAKAVLHSPWTDCVHRS